MLALRAGMKTDPVPPVEVSQRSRLDAPKAITATAHKLARIFYTVLRYVVEYRKRSEEEFTVEHRKRMKKNLHRRAKELSYELKKIEVPARSSATHCSACPSAITGPCQTACGTTPQTWPFPLQARRQTLLYGVADVAILNDLRRET